MTDVSENYVSIFGAEMAMLRREGIYKGSEEGQG
jgi:hypothetical protein